jgi:phosphatidylinositol-3,4,5-trisphosphate 3-phosphatase/dual-specificity protein phosphatase PTEN
MEQIKETINEKYRNPHYTYGTPLVPNYEIDNFEDSNIENPKIKLLNEETNSIIKQDEGNSKFGNFIKKLVSQNKTRFSKDGFDLDLTYITKNIIAMGLPSTSIESLYRNSMKDVQNFFIKRHDKHHKVYNLCDDKKYDDNIFYKQACFPFHDHEAPPLNLIFDFCEDAKKFLNEDINNVIAIHCIAGKGRTGCLICCLLLYLKYFETAYDCIKYYGLRRTDDGKGLTVPSQIRYVNYCEEIIKKKINVFPIKFPVISIKSIKLKSIPKIKNFSAGILIQNYNDYGEIVKEINNENIIVVNNGKSINFKLNEFEVCGDVKVSFFQKHMMNVENIFKFWFNTFFLPQNGSFIIKKDMIDKACKDNNNSIYDEFFAVEINTSTK